MNAILLSFIALYSCAFFFGEYIMLSPAGRRQLRQAVKYVYCGVKLLVAVAISPLLVLLFIVSPALFLPVFTFLWPHLDILRPDGSLYLRRWFMTPKTQWYRPRFLHLIAQDDDGRDPHSHPGRFTTKILAGGYKELVYFPGRADRPHGAGCCGDRTHAHHIRYADPGRLLDNPEDHTHMVKLFAPTWTWVVGWIRGKPWGFWKLHPTDPGQDIWIESEAYGSKGTELKSWVIRR